MANPTTNFGWQMPTSTDLVTDLPADFEVFGQAVDTALVDLKGGTTGQVLSKASNTNMDFTWVTTDDANAIQNTIVDAKGDLISATGSDVPARLAVGTNGQTLVADSSTATGLKWATPATPTFVGNRNQKTVNQSLTNATYTAITYNTETYDTDGFHSTATNTSRITIPTGKGGYYTVFVLGCFAASGAGARVMKIVKNGSTDLALNVLFGSGSAQTSMVISDIINLTAGDYIEVFAYQSTGGALDFQDPGGQGSLFGVQFLGA